jgi:very-short-patch-repair endonuclease
MSTDTDWLGGFAQTGQSSVVSDYDEDAPVLVAVVNNARDFARARDEGWYRIPVNRAPRRVAAEYLALYQTRAFGNDGYAVNYYAPVHRFYVVSRADLLPNEPDHPRAADAYYKIEIGPLQRLPRPVPSRALRRIAFIPTTLRRLLAAQEINDLWQRDDPQQRLWLALREAGLLVEYRYQVSQPGGDVAVDFALFCRDGRIAVLCDDADGEDDGLRERRPADYELAAEGWTVLRFSQHELAVELPRCAGAIVATVRRLGGQAVPQSIGPGSE